MWWLGNKRATRVEASSAGEDDTESSRTQGRMGSVPDVSLADSMEHKLFRKKIVERSLGWEKDKEGR
jgi:hypothetical protein